jgi:lipopolysaccharide/colanic/teichoic acid biosynthesis glycosyltransferase
VDDVYVNEILPGKMKYNLEGIERFSLLGELRIMVSTVLAVLR